MAQYVYALDINNSPVYVESAKIGNRYKCPDCNNEVFPKNKGKIKEHHFAHFSGFSHEGTGESENHSNTTLFLLDFFRSCLESGDKITIKVKCPDHRLRKHYNYIPYGIEDFNGNTRGIKAHFSDFRYNILEGINRIEREYSVRDINGTLFRPDLALLDGDKLLKAVEVVYSHEDSEEKTNYYKKNKIDVIRIDVKDFNDFFDIENKRDCFDDLKTTIYVNEGCPIRTTVKMLRSNLNTRLLMDELNTVFYEVGKLQSEIYETQYESSVLLNDTAGLTNEIRSCIQEEYNAYSKTVTFGQVVATTLMKELTAYTKKQKEIEQEARVFKLNPLLTELNEIKQSVDSLEKEMKSLSLEYAVYLYCLKEDIKRYKDFIQIQQTKTLKSPPDFEITNEKISRTKQDIVNFKNGSKYRSINWIHSNGYGRESFIVDYMKVRGLSCGFEFYNQVAYTPLGISNILSFLYYFLDSQ